jgi:hypothetical protein
MAHAILTAGCLGAAPPEKTSQPRQTVFFSDDFSGGLGNWSIKSATGGSMSIVDRKEPRIERALEMRSQFMKGAYAVATNVTMDWSHDYVVSFRFMLSHRDNYGYTVYRDRNAWLAMEEATGFACIEGSNRPFAGRFGTNSWHRVTLIVRPGLGYYDVLLDGVSQKECRLQKSDIASFVVGDEDPGDEVHGDGIWDDFRVTDTL